MGEGENPLPSILHQNHNQEDPQDWEGLFHRWVGNSKPPHFNRFVNLNLTYACFPSTRRYSVPLYSLVKFDATRKDRMTKTPL